MALFLIIGNVFCRNARNKSSSSSHCSQDNMDLLYPVTVVPSVGSTNNRVRIHYLSYSSRYDEWRDINNLAHLESPCILEDYVQSMLLVICTAY